MEIPTYPRPLLSVSYFASSVLAVSFFSLNLTFFLISPSLFIFNNYFSILSLSLLLYVSYRVLSFSISLSLSFSLPFSFPSLTHFSPPLSSPLFLSVISLSLSFQLYSFSFFTSSLFCLRYLSPSLSLFTQTSKCCQKILVTVSVKRTSDIYLLLWMSSVARLISRRSYKFSMVSSIPASCQPIHFIFACFIESIYLLCSAHPYFFYSLSLLSIHRLCMFYLLSISLSLHTYFPSLVFSLSLSLSLSLLSCSYPLCLSPSFFFSLIYLFLSPPFHYFIVSRFFFFSFFTSSFLLNSDFPLSFVSFHWFCLLSINLEVLASFIHSFFLSIIHSLPFIFSFIYFLFYDTRADLFLPLLFFHSFNNRSFFRVLKKFHSVQLQYKEKSSEKKPPKTRLLLQSVEDVKPFCRHSLLGPVHEDPPRASSCLSFFLFPGGYVVPFPPCSYIFVSFFRRSSSLKTL
ncbi:unnamed protein product [Acanthosepion pharaonis]|uniref:Uncharacterized protein n=1 Tax=Acanthosepion pharaonis TaxID=158019 RepID=A0A812C9W3_ACAPH|nr:unnamed protein product [Sepia pharaonis]